MQIPSGTYTRPETRTKYIRNRTAAFMATIVNQVTGKSEIKKTPFLEVTFADSDGATTARRYYTSEAAIGMLYELADHAGIANPEQGFDSKKLLKKKVALVMCPPKDGKYFEARTKETLDAAEEHAAWLVSKNSPPVTEANPSGNADDSVPF